MCQWIEREISNGAAVILVAPPKVSGVADNKKVSPYRAQVKYLAGLYGIPYIDASEQLSTITSMWTDGVHLSTFAYFELGWHIAALFSSREEKARSIAGGAFFLPQDNIMSTTNAALRTETLAVGGYLYQLTANAAQDIPFGAYFEEDVIPVIHSYNASTNTVTLRANYGGAPDSSNLAGVPTVELSHAPADGNRQRLYLPRVNKGYRFFSIWNVSVSQMGFIEAIEFIPVKDCLATNNGLLMKLNNLSGTHKPSRYYGSFPYWWAVEQSLKLVKRVLLLQDLLSAILIIAGLLLLMGCKIVPPHLMGILSVHFAMRQHSLFVSTLTELLPIQSLQQFSRQPGTGQGKLKCLSPEKR
jgi:hypothetical protein